METNVMKSQIMLYHIKYFPATIINPRNLSKSSSCLCFSNLRTPYNNTPPAVAAFVGKRNLNHLSSSSSKTEHWVIYHSHHISAADADADDDDDVDVDDDDAKERDMKSSRRRSMITSIGIVVMVVLMMGQDGDKAWAFGPEGPLVEEFWENVRRYGLYALTVSTGVLYAVLQPIVELLKNPISALLIILIFAGSFFIFSQILSAMFGVSDFDYQYAY